MKNLLSTILFVIALTVKVFAQDGNLDNSFNIGTGANSFVQTTLIQSDGKIMIGGVFTTYNGTSINRIARLNTDGTLDASFNPGIGANGTINKLTIQSDGKIIMSGQFTSYNGNAMNRIARLNNDGTLDLSFNPGTGANNQIRANSIQSDGKIIITGQFTAYNGTSRNRIARLNTDGTLDTTFDPGTGANDYIATNSIQNDGKIIIGGHFTEYNGMGINKIARLNIDGTLDSTFNPGTGIDNYVYSTSIQNNGKIIIGGTFTLFNGITINRIARLNNDGTLDNTFNPGSGASHSIESIAIQSDGKIIIGGFFTSYNGTSINRIARVNSDGTLDTSFNPGTGTTNGVVTITIQNDGKIIIGGDFTSYNGTARNNIARIMIGGCIVPIVNISPSINSLAIGSNAVFIATTGISTSFQWQSNSNNMGWMDIPNNLSYSGSSTNSLIINNIQVSSHLQPFRVIASSNNCIDTSNIAIIQVIDTCINTQVIYDTLTTTVTIFDTLTTYFSVTDTLIINTTITDINQSSSSNTIKIFPNPTNDYITIDYGNFPSLIGYQLKIENLQGQLVFQTNIIQQSDYLNLTSWGGNGLYFVHIIDPQGNTIDFRKIVLQ
jgi:uncharacterized delta-60 repeat protein